MHFGQRQIFASAFLIFLLSLDTFAVAQSSSWRREWPHTDFSRHTVNLDEIQSGGPPKDGIPAIDAPRFEPAAVIKNLGPAEPVIALVIDGVAKAYPLRVLTWHEIANDTIGGVPVTVTYCPLCNASIVFDRRVDGRVLDFGVSGKLRHSDLIMYDRQTESWWQQFLGEAIVGGMTGTILKRLPARIMPFSEFESEFSHGLVLVPSNPRAKPYGENPYEGYDTNYRPFLYRGDYNGPIPALAYVVAVNSDAWPLKDVRQARRIENGNLVITWTAGMNSALSARQIKKGRDIGFVTVRRRNPDGTLVDIPHDVTFAFAFSAFHPQGLIHLSK